MKLAACVLICLFLLLGANSCKLDIEEFLDKDEFFTIKGRLLKSCDDQTPQANKNLGIDAVPALFAKDVIVPETNTDENGFFTFRYENEGHTSFLSLSMRGNNKELVTNLPVFQNIELGDIFLTPEKPFIFQLKTDTAFSSVDTLFYHEHLDKNFNRIKRYITGPFTDGQVFGRDTVGGELIFSKIDQTSNLNLDLDEEWVLKSGNTIHKSGTHNEIFKPCTENKVIIDLTK